MQNKNDEDEDRRLVIRVWMQAVAAFLVMLALMVLAVLCSGCSTVREIPVERVVTRTDTVYSAKVRVDTVIVHDSIAVTQSGDTVYLTKYRDRFRYSERIDTVYQTAVDSVKMSVPYPVERSLTPWERTKMDFGGIAIGAAMLVAGIVAWLAIRRRRK